MNNNADQRYQLGDFECKIHKGAQKELEEPTSENVGKKLAIFFRCQKENKNEVRR
jgi:hypothetical protein